MTARRGTYRGILMPHHEFSGADTVTLKLESGYNVGLRLDDSCKVTLIEKAPRVLPLLDPEMAAVVEQELTDRGISLCTGSGL